MEMDEEHSWKESAIPTHTRVQQPSSHEMLALALGAERYV